MKRSHAFVMLLIAVCLLKSSRVAGQHVDVSVGEPTLWTLEQAHYHLSKQRMTNQRLETEFPGRDKLDPNALHGSRFDQLRMLLTGAVGFDAATGAQNELVLDKARADAQRRQTLIQQLDVLRARSTAVAEETATLRRRLAALDPDADAAEIRRINAEITILADLKTHVDAQTASLNAELPKATSDAPSIAKPTPSLAENLPESALKSAFDFDKLHFKEPRLHASTILDNFIQMQYELIVKQLALLRDDVGTDSRLVFIELPVSIYTRDTRGASKQIVQTQYRLNAYWRCRTEDEWKVERAAKGVTGDEQLTRRTADTARSCGLLQPSEESRSPAKAPASKDPESGTPTPQDQNVRPLVREALIDPATAQTVKRTEARFVAPQPNPLIRTTLSNPKLAPSREAASGPPTDVEADPADDVAPAGAARLVDLIPRQSALNVNAVHDEVKGISLGAVFAFLTGWGAKTTFERQREQFDQFVHQEIFASGFGKGRLAFGWTFGPNPGSRRIAPGIRNTFAALVIPRSAVSVELSMAGCAYERKDAPPACPAPIISTLPIATEQEGFWLRSIRYSTVPVGHTATVFLQGGHFSPQLAVLINGVPLKQRLDLANDFAPVAATAVPHGIQGDFEYVNQELVVLRFSMGPDFAGTPRIALVTPQKAAEINRFEVQINGDEEHRLTCRPGEARCADAIFNSVALRELRIINRTISQADPKASEVWAHVVGVGLAKDDEVHVNGQKVLEQKDLGDASSFHQVRFPAPTTEEWVVTLMPKRRSVVRLAVKNPLLFKRDGAAHVQPPVPAGGGKPETMVVTLKGGPFEAADDVRLLGGKLAQTHITPTQVVLQIENPADSITAIVTRKGTPFAETWSIEKPKPKKEAADASDSEEEN